MITTVQKYEPNIDRTGGEPVKRIMFDYSRLKGRIKEKCGTQKIFAEMLGVTEATMTAKLSGCAYFTQSEIVRAVEVLDILWEEVSVYFFAVKVQ